MEETGEWEREREAVKDWIKENDDKEGLELIVEFLG